MTMKSILCIFGGSESELHAAHTAFALGKAYGAHIRFLHMSLRPDLYAGEFGEGVLVTAAIQNAIEKENAARLRRAKKHVETLSAHYHVPLNSEEPPAHHASVRFLHETGRPEEVITREGRLSDLIVIGRNAHEPDMTYDSAAIASLFNTGRPVMMLPVRQDGSPGEYRTIAVAWKNGLEAARAMYNALPFLEKAEKVYVLTAEGPGETYDIGEEASLIEYMRLHGIHAQAVVVAMGALTAGEALETRARELQADLLVMGAYGHSRLRETLLGGVTSHMLEKADIPLLLSH